MAQCVIVNEAGALVVASTADPCTGLVVMSASEFAQVTANPFVLSVEDGALVSGAIGAVWCLAWALRAVRQTLNPDGEES